MLHISLSFKARKIGLDAVTKHQVRYLLNTFKLLPFSYLVIQVLYFCYIFRNSHFHQSQDSDDMRTKKQSLSVGESHDNENYISEHKLTAHDNKNTAHDKSSIDRQHERNKENAFEKKLLNRDSGNVICVEEEQNVKSENDNPKSSQGKPVKHPLHRKSSNITDDSGRSTVSDLGENVHDLQCDLNESQGYPSSHIHPINDPNRRESLTVIDATGHLTLPSTLECVKPLSDDSGNSNVESTTVRPHSAHNSSESQSPRVINRPGSGQLFNKRYGPKILYSNSEDSSLTQRSLSYPRSPYSSPSASPRLRRQPTMETRRISVSDGGDGYIQLNQYKLKDEIGKVT